MKISEYFNHTDSQNTRLSSSLPQGPFYSRTIKDFYDDLVGPQLDEIRPTILKEWSEMLDRYINLPVPIYWIRKYESGSKNASNNKKDNRRGALTLVVDKNNQLRFAYAFISNYDAQELYNMIRIGITPPTENEFLQMMFNGSYQFHYDPNGGDCQDDEVTYYEHRGNVRSGVLNAQGWYLAHIADVNDIIYQNDYGLSNQDIEAIFLSRGQVAEWKDVSTLPTSIQTHLSTSKISNGLSRRVRIINIDDIYTNFSKKVSGSVDESDVDKFFTQILQASFYRFVHPCNYFLVPSRKNECDFIYGRKQISIGEYKPLVEYVNKLIRDKFKREIDFAEFDEKLMLPNSNTKKSGSAVIHVCYGSKYSKTPTKSTGKGKKSTGKKDNSTYLFEGVKYKKRTLVLAVIKSHVKKHGITTFAELQRDFPDHLLGGTKGVVRRSIDISDTDKGIGGTTPRYFIKSGQTLTLSGEEVMVNNQWTLTLIDSFIKHSATFGHVITKV